MREDLKAYLDGELPPDRVAAIESALSKDSALQAELSELRSLRDAIRTGAVRPSVRGYEQTLVALKGSASAPKWFARPATAWSAVGLAASAVFAVWALKAQSGALESSMTSSDMRPAIHSPKIEGAGQATLLDEGESLPRAMIPGAMRTFELKVQDLAGAVSTVEKLAFEARADHIAKDNLGNRVKFTIQIPAASAEKFGEALRNLGSPPAKSEAATKNRTRTLAEADAKETVFEIVLVADKR